MGLEYLLSREGFQVVTIRNAKQTYENLSCNEFDLVLLDIALPDGNGFDICKKIKQEGKNLRSYFEENGYYEIAIYGMSYAGETLINELQGSNVKIKYGIDQNAENIYADINLVSPDDELENVDAIIITPIKFFDEIEKKLSKKVNCPILSLEDILYEV